MNTRKSVRPIQTTLAVAIVGALALLSTGAVIAQQAPAQQTPANAQPTQTEEAASPDATTLGTIFVTANKRVENIREVAASISVISEEQLDNLHVTRLTDFAAYVPGLQVVGSGTPGKTTIALRGIAPLSSGATVGTYIDETPLGSSGLYQGATGLALDLLPYDIGRVEVLRGPQGTLYGANSMGGLLKYVTRDPDLATREFRFGGGVSGAAGGSDEGWNARFGANLPLVEDRFAVRVSYARNEIPGSIDNAVDGRQDIDRGTQESARIAALWQLSDAVSLKLTAMQQSIDTENNTLVALDTATRRPLFGDLTNTIFVDEPFNKDIDFYAATLEADLGWADFTSASGYSDTSTAARTDATQIFGEFALLLGQPAAGSAFLDVDLDLQKFTQEFRLTSKSTGPFEWQLGAFYTKEEADNAQLLGLRQLDGTPLPPPFGSIFGTLFEAGLPSNYKETALFANGAYKFNDRFKLGGGVRFSRNEQDFAQIIQPGSPLLPPGTSPGSSEEDVFNWMISPQFQLTDDAMLYARVATGYQPGGPNVAVPGLPLQVDSSTLTSYELGLKSEFANSRVLFDLAAFRIDWEDIQLITAIGGLTGLINAGEATSQGLELSTAFKATDRLRLGFNAAYTDATLTTDSPLVSGFRNGLSGDRLPFVPKFSWSATADYHFPLSGDWNGHVGGGYRWVGDRKNGVTNTNPILFPTVTLDSYKALDLNADISNQHWTLRAYAKNPTDERTYLTIAPIQSQVTGVVDHLVGAPIQPRTFGIEVDYRF